MIKRSSVFVTIFCICMGCAGRPTVKEHDDRILRIKGSDSMLLLMQRWGESFMKKNDTISVSVEGGGSGDGIQALIDGSVDICASSRPMQPDEIRLLAARYNSIGVSILGARDALGVIVHPSNPVTNLSLEQVKKIYTGEITRWNEVGGDNEPVVLYSREPNSGTFLYFEEHVLLAALFSNRSIFVSGARALVDSIAKNRGAIGYSTTVYAKNVKLLSIDGFSHSAENVRNGVYPISRYLYLFTVHPPAGTIKKFIDWIVSIEGQNIVKENGYIPLYDLP